MQIRNAFGAGLFGCLAAASATALAQSTPAPATGPDPATSIRTTVQVVNPAAIVPAVLYRSVFVDTPKGVETEELDWKKANADVGQFKRGHVDILQWENRQGAKP